MKTWQREDKMQAADLRLRTSSLIYGSLQITIVNHRQGAELGYEAGRAAYRENCNDTVENMVHFYLAMPRYRPHTCTQKIVAEWRDMFLLGWTNQLLEDLMKAVVSNIPQPEYEASQGY